MLRECERVLRPGGRMAGLVIHTTTGLGEDGAALARELGPSAVTAVGAPPYRYAESAGFQLAHHEDLTDDFRATCEAILRERARSEAALRDEEGDEWFDEDVTKKTAMIEGIDRELLRRSLVVVRKPGRG